MAIALCEFDLPPRGIVHNPTGCTALVNMRGTDFDVLGNGNTGNILATIVPVLSCVLLCSNHALATIEAKDLFYAF